MTPEAERGAADGPPPAEQLAVLIVGMHRSGTSAVSGVLSKLGVATPESLHPADQHNPRGYFEPQRIIEFHEALFGRLGSPSNDPLPIPYDWVDSPIGRAAVEELADILDEEFGGRAMCLFKDPRICRLMPVWSGALARTGRRGVAVIPCRHPLEVAGSLQAKAGLSRAYALFMWLQHVVLGERFTRGMTRSFTGYDALLADWRSVVAKLERELGVVWPRDVMRAGGDIDQFLTGELRHHEQQALEPHDPLHALCARAWSALGRLQADAADAEAMAELDRIGAEIEDGARLFGPLVVSYQHDFDRIYRELLKSADDGRTIDQTLRAEIATRDEAISAQTEALRGFEAALAEIRPQLEESSRLLDERTRKMIEAERARWTLRRRYEEKVKELGWAQDGVRDRDRQIGEAHAYLQHLERERDRLAGEAHAAWMDSQAVHARLHAAQLHAHAIEQSNSWKFMFALQRVLGRSPALRRLLRVTAKGGWWLATGQFGRKLRERRAAIAAAQGLAPAPAPIDLEPEAGWIEPERAIVEATDAAPETEVVAPTARREGWRPLHITFLSGEPDTPGHLYRIKRHADAAEALGFSTSTVRIDLCHANLDEFRKADLVFIWRAAWDEVNIQAAIDAAREGGAAVVFDIDDLIVEPELAKPEIIDGMRSQRHDTDLIIDYFARMQRTLRAADYGCAPTPYLAEFLQRYSKDTWNKLTFQLPNGFDDDVVRRSRLAARRRRNEADDGLVRIGYAAGSKTHQADFGAASEAVADIMREHPEVRLVLFRSKWGEVLDIAEFPAFDGLMEQVEWREIVPLPELPNEVARFDINLAPLEVGNIFCEAKSELKYFEAALVDVPTVASPTEPYRNAIRHGETGFLANTREEWYAAIKALVEDKDLRRTIARAAQYDLLVKFGPERRTQAFLSMVDQALARGRRSARAFAFDQALLQGAPSRVPTIPPHEIVVAYDSLEASDVTVVIPLYNYAGYVTEALDSVKAQTLRDIDLVVVDDRSTDESAAVAEAWIHENAWRFNRAVLIRNEANSGLAFTRNVAFAAAETPYVLPLDADNRLRPKAAERLLEAIRKGGAAYAYPLIRQFGTTELANDEHPLGLTPYDPGRFRNSNYIDAMALVRRAAWAMVGGYDHIQFGWEDYDFWCKLVERGEHGEQVPEVLAEYRLHVQSMLRSETDLARNKQLLIENIEQRHPWLSIAATPPRASGSTAANPRSDAEQLARLERILPHLRCPDTGQPLALTDGALRTADGVRVWPLKEGRPVLFPGLDEVRVWPGDHVSNELPERALAMIEATKGLVLNLSAGGSARDFDHVVEAEFAIFRHTDVVADAHRLPFADATFELVVSMNAFEHYHSPELASAEIMRVLKPGGQVLVRTAFLQPLHEAPWHFYNTTRYGLQKWFKDFDPVQLHVSDNFNPAYTLAWSMSEAEAMLRNNLSAEDAERFRKATAEDFVRMWRDPSSRDHPVWRTFFELPADAQEGLAAGFEYLGRKGG